jgi:hypothetical protein
VNVGEDLLGGPQPTLLPADSADALLESGTDAREVVIVRPTCSAAWAALADDAYANDDVVASYAFARTGYHRGLDALRRAGWKGFGPVPWEHAPNRGFLRALYALGRAARAIGELDEAVRCEEFLRDSSITAVEALEAQEA